MDNFATEEDIENLMRQIEDNFKKREAELLDEIRRKFLIEELDKAIKLSPLPISTKERENMLTALDERLFPKK